MITEHQTGFSQPLSLRIFLASPSDVASERALVRAVIERIQFESPYFDKVVLDLVSWDDISAPTPVYASMAPQTAMKTGLPTPAECEIVVVILWSRFGTPLRYPEYSKADGTPYRSGTEWEYFNALEASSRNSGRPAILLYRRAEEPRIGLADSQRDHKIEQWKAVQNFFAQFQDATGALIGGVNTYETPAQFEEKFARHIRREIDRFLIEQAGASHKELRPAPRALAHWRGSPYPGLRAFVPTDSPVFFGRTAEVDDLLRRLSEPRTQFLCVVGASGSGKSSLVAAGLIPRLHANGIEGSKDWLLPGFLGRADGSTGLWTGLRFTPGELGDDPFLALAAKLKDILGRERGTARDLADRLTASPFALREACLQALTTFVDWSEVLIFVDQLEEVLTTVAERFRLSFLEALVAACSGPRVRVICTLRSDFYPKLIEYGILAPHLRVGTFPLSNPSLTARTEMVTGPALRGGLAIERGLVDQIVNDSGYDQGALALLAFALQELYKTRTKSTVLTRDAYLALGGVGAAIGRCAEATYATLSEQARAQIGAIFGKLIVLDSSGAATRIRVTRSRLPHCAAADEFLDAFINARLLVSDTGPDGWVIDIAHEALLREWPSLRKWIEERSDDLRVVRQAESASAEWARSQHSDSHLWPHERLERFRLALVHLDMQASSFDEVVQQFTRPEADRLLYNLEMKALDHHQRVALGDRLAIIADERRGIGVHPDGTPDLVWCQVEGGNVVLPGENNGSILLKAFEILKYPITYAQWRTFVEDPEGFYADRWWDGLERPLDTGSQLRRACNSPAENVSWFDASAFARWLSERLGTYVRLPTEWEWQHAASAGSSRRYPWGDSWDSARANTEESGLGRTSAVGMYPNGAAKCGALDLAGNVWEWCLNSYHQPLQLTPDAKSLKALKGGSWLTGASHAQTGGRGGNLPATRAFHIGIRLIRPFDNTSRTD